jgi:hypothetical protein
MMIDILTVWLSNQSAGVRAEVVNLLEYKPESEFIQTLADLLPIVPVIGLVDLYYDIFYCCKPVFKMAIKHLHSPEALSNFLVLAERALVSKSDFDAFLSDCSDGDEIDEVIFWLKRHASLHALTGSSEGR